MFLIKLFQENLKKSHAEVYAMKDIRKLREARGMSQRELAKVSGISQSFISKLERQETKEPCLHTIECLAKGLGIETVDLID